MLDPIRETQDPTNTASLVLAVADYAAAFAVAGESVLATGRHCLIDALARGFEALQDPECASSVAPLVPGALMPGGARVPGTSLELEPAQAAFCIGLMLCRPAGADHWPASSRPCAADVLGAILAAADYQARKSTMEGKAPAKVRDLLAAIVKALEIQGVLAALDERNEAIGHELRSARVTASAIAAALLGGTPGQIARAVSHASLDGEIHVHAQEQQPFGRRHWVAADTLGRAVRLACQATAAGRPSALTSTEFESLDLAGRVLGAGPLATSRKRFGTELIDRLGHLRQPQDVTRLTRRFRAAVDSCFPTRQAERVKALFAAPERLDDLPVNELIAALVTNGARQR
ncbi:MAG: hypothetical protein HIU85_09850 [Proteobacteria bacterium]|nr:hypothetical protein [Pseudomonadota bacterium]